MEPQERYPVGESAGDADAVTAARRELAGVDDLPLADHADAFGRVHTSLQRALSEINDA